MKSYVATLFVFMLVLLTGCKPQASLDEYTVEQYRPAYAKGFRILGAEGRKSVIIESIDPWQGAKGVVQRLFIARDGEKAPSGFDGQVIEGEARRIVCMSSTQVAMLAAIGEEERIVGVSGLGFISNDKVRKAADMVDVGYDSNINYELIVAQDPDLVLLYGTNGANSIEGKLRQLEIPYLYVGEFVEDDPLAKAEWMVAVAEIVGKRQSGEKTFAEIPRRYNALKQKVAAAAQPAPKVMLNTPYGDSWFMPCMGSYQTQLISDAGGDYIYKKNKTNSSQPVDIEEAYMLVTDADCWINVGQCHDLATLRSELPRFADTGVMRSGRVYNSNARSTDGGGNDYWESGVMRPDLVLRDLVKIFHPDLVDEDFVYYKQLK